MREIVNSMRGRLALLKLKKGSVKEFSGLLREVREKRKLGFDAEDYRAVWKSFEPFRDERVSNVRSARQRALTVAVAHQLALTSTPEEKPHEKYVTIDLITALAGVPPTSRPKKVLGALALHYALEMDSETPKDKELRSVRVLNEIAGRWVEGTLQEVRAVEGLKSGMHEDLTNAFTAVQGYAGVISDMIKKLEKSGKLKEVISR